MPTTLTQLAWFRNGYPGIGYGEARTAQRRSVGAML